MKLSKSLLIAAILVVMMPGAVSWWNSDWQYRSVVEVEERSGESLENYQLKLNLDTESLISEDKMQSDCSDVRLTGSNDSEKLDYWIESGCNTQDTTIWVQKQSLESLSTEKIYMYYGNFEVDSESSGERTFSFFDDFEDGSLNTSKWDIIGGSSYLTEEGGYLDIQNVYSGSSSSQGEIQNGVQASSANFGYSHSIHARVKDPDGSGSKHYGAIILNDGNQCYTGWDCSGQLVSIYERDDDIAPDAQDEVRNGGPSQSRSFGSWREYRLDYLNGTKVEYFENGVKIDSRSSSDEIPDNNLYPALGGQDHDDNNYHKYTDYVFVRNKVGKEPSVSIVEQAEYNLCDKRGPKNECIANSTRDLSGESFEISSVFQSLTSTHLTSLGVRTDIEISNRSIISGIWEGSFNISSDDLKLKPGASFRPGNERIILDERD